MPKEDPAIAKPGWVVKARRLAAPGSSLSEPKLVVPAVMPAMLEVPVLVRFPLARGIPATGRTRTLVPDSEQLTPPMLNAVLTTLGKPAAEAVNCLLVPGSVH